MFTKELFDYEKQDFAEIHIFVNNVDFEVIDIPIINACPDWDKVNYRMSYWKKMGYKEVHYELHRVITRLIAKEVKQ